MGPRRNLLRTQIIWLAAVDAVCLFLAVVIGVALRIGSDSLGAYVLGHIEGWIYFCGSIILANYVVGSYGIRISISRFNLLVNWMFSLIVALLVLSITSYAWFEQLVGRGVLIFSVVAYAFLTLFVRSLLYGVAFRSKFFTYRTAILGTGKRAREVRKMLEGRHILPAHRVSAYVRPSSGPGYEAGQEAAAIDGVAVVRSSVAVLEDMMHSLGVDQLVVAPEEGDDVSQYYPVLRRLRLGGVEVMDALTAAEIYSGKVALELVDDAWLMQASMQPSLAVVGRFKRLFDIVIAMVLAVIAVPVGLLVALLIKLTAPRSPCIYMQERVGQFGRVFQIYKFRTMIENAEGEGGAVWSHEGDPRITRLGRVLRKFRLDEIPQLLNVLNGEMSIVGPRPERPEIVAEIEKTIPYLRERENVPPGLTGWAQVQYPYTNSVEDVARKLEFDLYYMKNLSVKLDIQIILRTLRIILFGKERST